MTTPKCKILVYTAILSSLALFSSGCGKPSVVPPDSGTSPGTSLNGGTDFKYPDSEFQDSDLNNGTLDDTSGDGQNLGSMTINGNASGMTDEDKKKYGRSSHEMEPIYFDFDQAIVRTDMMSRMDRNADYLKNSPGVSVLIEGNCDDRGTNEYNLALGERRAITAKENLIILGVDPNRVRTISYGEERPLFNGDSDFDWAQNRRDDFILE